MVIFFFKIGVFIALNDLTVYFLNLFLSERKSFYVLFSIYNNIINDYL
jgi:hypothetical protein